MNSSILQAIIEHLFGKKYYANIVNRRGTPQCELSSFIFSDPIEAANHRIRLQGNRSYAFVETVTFRAHSLDV